MAHVVDIVDRIEEMFIDVPDKRKKKEYQEWKNTINKLIEEVNKLSKTKMYLNIK
jgi:replicative DNA helicase